MVSVGRLLIIVESIDLRGAFARVCCLSDPHGGAIRQLFNPIFYWLIYFVYRCLDFVLKYRILNSIQIRSMGHQVLFCYRLWALYRTALLIHRSFLGHFRWCRGVFGTVRMSPASVCSLSKSHGWSKQWTNTQYLFVQCVRAAQLRRPTHLSCGII